MKISELRTTLGRERALQALLVDAVTSGASIGFLPPITSAEATAYWADVETGLGAGQRKLFVAHEGERVIGAVQLSLCRKGNGRHRGEVEKLMVRTDQRGRGIARALMAHLEQVAQQCGLLLLVLDTRLGDVASMLYQSIGFVEAGQIPHFARSADGRLDATVIFYKFLNIKPNIGEDNPVKTPVI
ncbi:GNAT family N-acetyltransferase [Ferrimonas balearica]|uniref:GNAT family N-acetyltransferase n=1 Tax=Ferrimonas balearica TaxID=44012 RepID=UPI001C57676B|nr:GNAT family N-acetyltransferase [Ferrimonas balearica]MBY6105981.1 GNAT family N-acetyltransferase [Ferrimonas balearica]